MGADERSAAEPGHPFYSRLNRALESEGFDERGMEESGGSGREDRQNEGWSYPSGPQNRAGRGPDDGGDRVGDGPGREPGRHEHAGQDAQGRRDSDRARSEADPCLPSRRPAGSGWRQGVTTPLRFSRSWTLRGCVRTYPNPTVVVGDGGATPRAVAWCTRTVGEAAGHEVSVCTASEENGWSDPSLISTEPAA